MAEINATNPLGFTTHPPPYPAASLREFSHDANDSYVMKLSTLEHVTVAIARVGGKTAREPCD